MVHNVPDDWTINDPLVAIEVIGHFININTAAINIFVPFSFVCTSDDFRSETAQLKHARLPVCFIVVIQFLFHAARICFFLF